MSYSRASLVIGLYGAMSLLAVLIAAGRGDPNLYAIGSSPAWLFAIAPLVGVVVGLVVVWLTRVANRHFAWARDLHISFRDVLGELSSKEILILAVASSVGEELLFRGALMPWLGVWVQALIFALLHVGPGKRFLPWTAMAAVLGVAFGELARETGGLGAPIAAHFTINFLNLRFIVRRSTSQRRMPGASHLARSIP